MKRKNIRMLQTIALVAGLAASASIASAAGQIGQRYLKGTLDGVFWDSGAGLDDGFGASLTYNQPLATSFDLGLGYQHLSSDFDGVSGDLDSDVFFFNGTWYTPAANGKLYVRPALGWTNVDTSFGDDSEWAWAIETGLEIPVGSKATVTPYISYTDFFEGDVDGTFDFGVLGELEVGSKTSVVLDVSVNEDSDVGVSGGVLFRF